MAEGRAETSIDRFVTRTTTERRVIKEQAQPPWAKTEKRARRLKAAGKATLTGLGSTAMLATMVTLGEAERGPKHEPGQIKPGGIIEIIPHPEGKTPLNFRDRSSFPVFQKASNAIPQSQVNLPSGETAVSVDKFYVSNYLLEEGDNPSRGEFIDPSSRGVWLVFPETDGSMTRISLSPETWGYWRIIVEAKTKAGKLNNNGDFVLDSGKIIPQNEVSQVSLGNPLKNRSR